MVRGIVPYCCLLLELPAAAQVHRLPVSPGWFPSQPAELRQTLDRAFGIAELRTGSQPPRKQLLALLAPHAGLAYSGAIAAAAWRRLGHPKNVIVLAFSHQRFLHGVMAPDLKAYATPLGEMSVNRQAVRELGFPLVAEDRLCDHSMENQLPFLQRAAPAAGLIPLYVGQLDAAALNAAARKLAGRVRAGDVIAVSSDLTHYGKAYGYEPFPNDSHIADRLRERTEELLDRIGALDVPAFDRFLETTRDNTCGRAPIRLLMATLAQLGQDVYLSPVDYMPSGELTRDYSLSVSYGALAFYPAAAFTVGPDDRKKLLASARNTLESYLAGKRARVPVPSAQRDSDLEQREGVFVTIRKNGELRGCIGSFGPARPLWDEVADRTLAAAAEDPRFPPLTAKEPPVSLEISLLTPLKRLTGWRQFHLGEGAIIELGARSGTLLPQVAAEMHWNREQFLEGLARKAGLEPKAYREPRARIYVYGAQVFGER